MHGKSMWQTERPFSLCSEFLWRTHQSPLGTFNPSEVDTPSNLRAAHQVHSLSHSHMGSQAFSP